MSSIAPPYKMATAATFNTLVRVMKSNGGAINANAKKWKNLSLTCMDRSWPIGSSVTKAIATARKSNMEKAIICDFLCFRPIM